MRGLKKKSHEKGQHTDGHRDSMKELAKGRFFEKQEIGTDCLRLVFSFFHHLARHPFLSNFNLTDKKSSNMFYFKQNGLVLVIHSDSDMD